MIRDFLLAPSQLLLFGAESAGDSLSEFIVSIGVIGDDTPLPLSAYVYCDDAERIEPDPGLPS